MAVGLRRRIIPAVLGLVLIGACASEPSATDPLCDAGVAAARGPSVANLEALADVADGLDEPDRSLLIDAAHSLSEEVQAFEAGSIDSYDTGELAAVVSEMCPDHEVLAQIVSR